MKADYTSTKDFARPTPLIALALVAIILVNVLGSWHWVRTNVTLLGGDATSYLEKSVIFADLLATPSLRSLFQVLTYDDYRTPLLFIAVQPFYALFGITLDSAQIFNILCLAVVIALTYQLGRTMGSARMALFAALLVALFPMMAAMARLFYTEIFLTTMVVLNWLALIRSDGFSNRRWSLWWGASLGIGLLIKWTMPIYLLLPLVVQLWGRPILHWQTIGFDRRRALLATGAGLALSFLWFWPNRQDMHFFLLGNGLWLGWFICFALFFYLWSTPVARTTNFWLAVSLSVAIASVWYLPFINFPAHLLAEDSARGQEGANPLTWYNYWRNLLYLYEQHLGALASLTLLPALLFPWLTQRQWRKSLSPHTALLWWGLLSAFLILGWISQSNSRNLVPLLPAIALLAALSLQFYPWRAALLIGSLWVVVLGVQWSLFTFDPLAPFYQRTAALWVMENYTVQPASGLTSPLYAIHDDLFQTITKGQPEKQRLGFLIHTRSLNRGSFSYYIRINQINAQIVPLTAERSRGWFDTLSAPWVLVKDGSNHDISPPAQDVAQRIFGGDPIFHTLYQEVKRYPLPNQETAYLYHRRRGPGRPLDLPQQVEATGVVADAIRAAWSPHASLTYANPDLAVWVGMHDPARERVQILDPEKAVGVAEFDGLMDTQLVVWNHDAGALQQWFDEHGYRAYEVGNDFAAVAVYGLPTQPLQPLTPAAAWADFRIEQVATTPALQAGQVLPITLVVTGTLPPGTKVSLRLLDAQGTMLASHDRFLQAQDRLGLLIPPLTLPGAYQVVAVVYDEATLLPLPDRDDATATPLFTVTVRP